MIKHRPAQLIGTFSGRARVGRPRSQSPVDVWLDQTKQQLPIVAEKHIECVVYIKVCSSLGGSRSTNVQLLYLCLSGTVKLDCLS